MRYLNDPGDGKDSCLPWRTGFLIGGGACTACNEHAGLDHGFLWTRLALIESCPAPSGKQSFYFLSQLDRHLRWSSSQAAQQHGTIIRIR